MAFPRSPSRVRFLLVVAALVLAGCATPSPPAPDLPAVVHQALPSVVLLVREDPDGTQGWGAGFAVTPDHRVLTNLHVVDGARTLRAMVYREDRPTWTPLDGGLSRTLFEHEAELVPATILRADRSLDLAVVQVQAPQGTLPPLPVADGPPVLGEPVLALGHPREAVWSFTSGVVSALHQGAIQHDAAINAGNSGGPLLDAQGRVLGINTSKVFGGAEGVAFAIPMDLARRGLDAASDVLPLDRSTPDRAARSCLEAQELASVATLECYDWDWKWQVMVDAAATVDALGLAPPGTARRLLEERGGREGAIARLQRSSLAWFQPGTEEPEPTWELSQEPPVDVLRRGGLDPEATLAEDRRLAAALDALEAGARDWTRIRNGLTVPLDDGATARQVLKSGVRVEGVSPLTPASDPPRAWVRIAGRNPDGTRYAWSELYRMRDGAWVQLDPVTAEDLVALPAGWPPPFEDPARTRLGTLLGALRRLGWSAATAEERAEAGRAVRASKAARKEPTAEITVEAPPPGPARGDVGGGGS